MLRFRRGDPGPALPPAALPWLLAALALAMLPHLTRLPWWITALFLIAAGWRWHVGRDPQRLPRGWLLTGLTLAVAAALLYSYGTLLGKQAGVGMLASMSALKLLEARRSRDAQVLVLLGFFLVLAQLLYSQHLATAGYLLATVTLLLSAQTLSLPQHAGLRPAATLRLSATMLLQALPVMALLFVLFPRIPGPLWGLPKDAHSGLTGLSDHMTPGSISELIQSPEIAFRVQFHTAPPPASALYWRGPVLPWYHRGGWRAGSEPLGRTLPHQPLGRSISYDVTLEPHGGHLLFALDLPNTIPSAANGITPAAQLWRHAPLYDRLRYRAASTLEYRSAPLTPLQRRRHLQLPGRGNPQTRALSARWRETADDDRALVERALRLFREQAFFYTLTPPLLKTDDSVDEFLFASRAGFCEHYAGSFVYMMRAAGVPARVVTGYQGGEYNDGYLLVRQSDAHAWAEVWLPDHGGWVRVDPTAAVAPERVEHGLYAAVDDPGRLPLLARGDQGWLRRLALGWDSVNNVWNNWVLGYDKERQRDLFSAMTGVAVGGRELLLALIAALALCAVLAGGYLSWRRRRHNATDRLARTYLRFCRKMAGCGLPRRADEGPLAYADRVAEARPELASSVRAIATLYARARYAGAESELQRLLTRQVQSFRPGRVPRG